MEYRAPGRRDRVRYVGGMRQPAGTGPQEPRRAPALAKRFLVGRMLAATRRLARAFALRDELRSLPRPDTTVCRCEDVPLGRLAMAASAREAKLLTRAGMGACQGRVCGAALGFLRGFAPDRVRPPLVPVPVAVLAEEEERL